MRQRGLTVTKEEAIKSLRLEYITLHNDVSCIKDLSMHSVSVLTGRMEQIKTTLTQKYGVNAR